MTERKRTRVDSTPPTRRRAVDAGKPAAKRPAKQPAKQPAAKPDTDHVGIVADAIMTHEIEILTADQIIPYANNPRINEHAIPEVMASIRSFGFINPIVVDVNNEIIVGHTRFIAGKRLGMNRFTVIRANHLTPQQVAAFRILDNKVGEAADWDFQRLSVEVSKMDEAMRDVMLEGGFAKEQIDCLSAFVLDDCLDTVDQNDMRSYQESSGMEGAKIAIGADRNVPATTRWVIGELIITMPADVHTAFMRSLREECNFDNDLMRREVLSRMGADYVPQD